MQFLLVNMTGGRETQADAEALLAEEGYTFPVLFDLDLDAAMTYGVTALPTTYFLDAEGNLVAWAQGAIDAETLQKRPFHDPTRRVTSPAKTQPPRAGRRGAVALSFRSFVQDQRDHLDRFLPQAAQAVPSPGGAVGHVAGPTSQGVPLSLYRPRPLRI